MSAGFFCINGLFDSCPLCLSHILYTFHSMSVLSLVFLLHGMFLVCITHPSSLASILYTLYHRTSYLLSDTFSVAVSCLSFICFSLYFISNVFSSSPLSFHSFPIVPYSPFLSYFIPSPFPNFLFCSMWPSLPTFVISFHALLLRHLLHHLSVIVMIISSSIAFPLSFLLAVIFKSPMSHFFMFISLRLCVYCYFLPVTLILSFTWVLVRLFLVPARCGE